MKDGCFIPKLWFLKEENRYLKFHELMSEPIGQTHNGNTFQKYIVRKNTPDEIKDVLIQVFEQKKIDLKYLKKKMIYKINFKKSEQKTI